MTSEGWPISPDMGAASGCVFQTGVDPKQAQATRKALQKEKANQNDDTPSLKVSCKVRLHTCTQTLLTLQTCSRLSC